MNIGINTYNFRERDVIDIDNIIRTLGYKDIGLFSGHIEHKCMNLNEVNIWGVYVIFCDISSEEKMSQSLTNIMNYSLKIKNVADKLIFIPTTTSNVKRVENLVKFYDLLNEESKKIDFKFIQEIILDDTGELYFQSVEELLQFNELMKDRDVNYILDTFYFQNQTEFEKVFKVLGDKVKSVHISNRRGENREFLYKDKAGTEKLLTFLKSENYNGLLEIEVFSEIIDMMCVNDLIEELLKDKELLVKLI